MKIGFYSPYLDTFGGGERYLLTLASHLAKTHRVEIFWDDSSIKAPLTRFLKIDLSRIVFVKNIFRRNLFAKCLSTFAYDVIFVLSDGSVPSTFAKKNILHFQVPFNFPPANLITNLKLKRYRWLIANSNFTKNFIDKSFGVNAKVIYPPVDLDSIKSGKKENFILSVGRFSSHQLHPKKQEVLIEVFKGLSKQIPTWRLILAGQAKKEDQKYLRSLKKSSAGYAIKIFENLSFYKLKDLYAKASIYWHATGFGEDEYKHPEKMEHFGITTVEASAAGAVPIVIAKGGQKEIVKEGKSGLLWYTKTQLYESTLALVNDAPRLHSLSKAAITNSRKFSKGVFIREYEKIIF